MLQEIIRCWQKIGSDVISWPDSSYNCYFWILLMLLPICTAQCHEYVALSRSLQYCRLSEIKDQIYEIQLSLKVVTLKVPFCLEWIHYEVFVANIKKNDWSNYSKKHYLHSHCHMQLLPCNFSKSSMCKLKVLSVWDQKTFDEIHNPHNWAQQYF